MTPDIVLDNVLQPKNKEPMWIRYIHQRLNANKNMLLFVSGATGTGKSWICLSLEEMLMGSRYNPNKHTCFTALEVMDLINSGTLQKGDVITLEESGVALSHREWQSRTNKLINFLLQTFRNMNIVLIMNSPYMDFLDSSSRKLFHAEFSTVSIDRKKRTAKVKPMLIQYNSRMKKFYYKFLRVVTKKGTVPIKRWNIPAPSKETIRIYEQRKTAYTQALNRHIYEELEEQENKGKKKVLTDKQETIVRYLKAGLTLPQIAEKLDRHRRVIQSSVELIKKKGYEIRGIYQGNNVVRYKVIAPDEKE